MVYATLLTNPCERTTPAYEPVMTIEPRAAGAPQAIHAIFYPGETTGLAFVYQADSKR